VQILRGHVGDPQALQDDRFELLFNAGHEGSMRVKKKSIPQRLGREAASAR
jgi:hypothetical protein